MHLNDIYIADYLGKWIVLHKAYITRFKLLITTNYFCAKCQLVIDLASGYEVYKLDNCTCGYFYHRNCIIRILKEDIRE